MTAARAKKLSPPVLGRPSRPPPPLALGCYTPTQRWQVDSLEYADKLPDDAKAWLAKFLYEHYHGVRRGLQPLELQRDSDRARGRNEDDLLTRGRVINSIDEAEGSGGNAVGSERYDANEEKLHEELDNSKAERILSRLRAFRGITE